MNWLNRSRGAHLVAAAAFAAMLAVFFAPALVGNRVFTDTATQQGYVYPWASTPAKYPFALQSDQADLSMPALAVQQRAYDHGELPYVDLYSYGGGNPLYADFATGQAYPPRILVAQLFSPVVAHLVFTLLHLFGAAMFTYLLVRRSGSRWLTGVLAGSSWMLGGWTLAWMQLAPILVTSALLPAGLLAMHALSTRRTWRTVTLTAIALGSNLIAGHFLFGVVSAAVVGLYGICLWIHASGRSLRSFGAVVAAGAVGALLSAYALLPLVVTQSDAARAPMTYAELTAGQLGSWRDVATALWPFSAPLDIAEFNAVAFVGVLTGLVALVGLFGRRPGSGLGRTLVVVSALTMVGGPVTWLVFHIVPTMDLFRPYTRLALFLGFGVVMSAAAGFEMLADAAGRLMVRTGRGRLRLALFVVAAVAIGANALQLMYYGRDNNPAFAVDDGSAVFPTTPFVTALRDAASSTPWPGRAVALSAQATGAEPWSPPILWAAESAWIGVESSSGYNATMPRRTQRNLRVLTGETVSTVVQRDGLGAYTPDFFWSQARYELFARNGYDLVVTPPTLNSTSAWGVQHVGTGELTAVYEGADGNIYRITGAVAGAHGVSAVEIADDETAALTRFTDPDFDASTTVLLSSGDARRIGSLSAAEVSGGQRDVNGYRFDATATGDSLVVVPVNWNDGWSATVDGHDVTVLRGNYNQVVVPVPSGTSHVVLTFRAPGISAGTTISVVTVATLIVGPIVARRRRNRHTVAA